jgi:hypothetical protein
MRTRTSSKVIVGLVAVASFVLVAFGFQAQRSPASSPVLAAAAAVQGAQFSLDPDTLVGWYEGPAQPIFFSHRRHAGEFEIECLYCHSNADISPIALMPPVELCLGCHRVVKASSSEIQRLRGYEADGEPIPWERVYKLYDFVQFNHGRHMLAELECQECHGEVQDYDVLWQWASLTMGWCLECHWEPAEDEQKLANAARNSELYNAPGREEHGLYPRSIDSDYGVTKGPIDCAACHY